MNERDAVTQYIKDLRAIQRANPSHSLMDIYRQTLKVVPDAARWAAMAEKGAAQDPHQQWVHSVIINAIGQIADHQAVALSSPKLVPILRKLDAKDAAARSAQ